MLVDAHAHLDLEQYDQDRSEVIAHAKAKGLKLIIDVGIDPEGWEKSLELARQNPGYIYLVLGLHPNDILREADPNETMTLLEKHIAGNTGVVVAVGETGLDYYHDDVPSQVQKEFFLKHIALARRYNLPLVIHCRDAMPDLLDIMQEHGRDMPYMMHCFSGTLAEAEACMAISSEAYISLAGPVTFKNALNHHEVARQVPLERLLVETDCPFLTPHPYRGRRNEPANVRYVAQKIADLRAIPYDEVIQKTGQNVYNLFNIK